MPLTKVSDSVTGSCWVRGHLSSGKSGTKPTVQKNLVLRTFNVCDEKKI